MAIKKSLSSFDEGLHRLRTTHDFHTLRDTIKEMFAICPPERRHLAHAQIASVLRNKQIEEMDRSAKDVTTLQNIDLKYKNLALVLKSISLPGLKAPVGTPGGISNSRPVGKTQLPVSPKVSELSGTEMGLNMIKGWISSKKKLIVRGALAAGALGAVAYLYKSYYDKGEKPRKNPISGEDKSLHQFERTLSTLKRFKAFTEASKHGSWEDYEDLWKGNSTEKKRRLKKQEVQEKDPIQDWDKWEKNLLNNMEEVSNSISSYERRELPKLALDTSNPPSPKLSLLTGSSEPAEELPVKKIRKVSPQRRKRLPALKEIENSAAQDPEPEPESKTLEKPVPKRTRRIKG